MRQLDHLVLPVSGLDVARARLETLGFTVAPDGIHPFGTANCCVFFRDGTYLEPLAITDPAKAFEAAVQGNTFLKRHAVWQAAHGDTGCSAIVGATSDAVGDHRRFQGTGISAGQMVEFSRNFDMPNGETGKATFLLAFAAGNRKDDAFAFTCQRRNMPAAGRDVLERHGNGVSGIGAVVYRDPDPARLASFLGRVSGEKPVELDGRIVVPFGNSGLYITEGGDMPGVVTSIHFSVDSFEATEALLEKAIPGEYEKQEETLVVAQAQGQGVEFVFEAD